MLHHQGRPLRGPQGGSNRPWASGKGWTTAQPWGFKSPWASVGRPLRAVSTVHRGRGALTRGSCRLRGLLGCQQSPGEEAGLRDGEPGVTLGHPPLLPPKPQGYPWALTSDPCTSGLDQGSRPHTALLTQGSSALTAVPLVPEPWAFPWGGPGLHASREDLGPQVPTPGRTRQALPGGCAHRAAWASPGAWGRGWGPVGQELMLLGSRRGGVAGVRVRPRLLPRL